MKVVRSGSQRNHGITTVVPGFSLDANQSEWWKTGTGLWDFEQQTLTICANDIPLENSFSTSHDYRIVLSLHDVAALLAIVGNTATRSNASALRKHLGEHIPALVKLLACATGLVPTPIDEADPAAQA